MSKVVKAINVMISNQDKISHIIKNGNEFFFLYIKKQKWSISKNNDGDYTVYFYPGNETLESLAKREASDWDSVNLVPFSSKELKTKEALESFSELYKVLSEKIYNMDQVFDEIFKEDDHGF